MPPMLSSALHKPTKSSELIEMRNNGRQTDGDTHLRVAGRCRTSSLTSESDEANERPLTRLVLVAFIDF